MRPLKDALFDLRDVMPVRMSSRCAQIVRFVLTHGRARIAGIPLGVYRRR